MGTNFYIRKKLSEAEKNNIKTHIDNEDWRTVGDLIPEEIHIGKRSGGWKFLWDSNNFVFFKPNKESLMKFLKEYGQIYDEYGKKFTFDEFINDEIKDFIDGGHDLESYYKENPEIYRYYASYNEIKIFEEYGVNPNQYGEFYIDNLRFSIYTNFG